MMSGKQLTTMSTEEKVSRYEIRQRDWMPRHESPFGALSQPYTIVAGIGLVTMSMTFLLETSGIVSYSQWWVLLLLIAALDSYMAAWKPVPITENSRIP